MESTQQSVTSNSLSSDDKGKPIESGEPAPQVAAQPRTNSSDTSKENNKTAQPRVKTVSYSRTIEFKDGKLIETCKATKSVNDEWFTLGSDGKWVSSSKEAALENSHTKEIEQPKYLYYPSVFHFPTYHMRRPLSLLDWW